MAFFVRMGRGVSLSASSRGLRAHVGPRRARVHFGSGRPGVSTGAGPFTYYTSLSGTRTNSRGRAVSGTSAARLTQFEKEQQFVALHAQLQAILDIHKADFPRAERQIATPSEPKSEHTFYVERRKEFAEGIPFWKLGARKGSRSRARTAAQLDYRAEQKRVEEELVKRQGELDSDWELLCSNDPEMVIRVVDAAFEDNSAPAAPVDVEGDQLSLVMLAPSIDLIPERKPALTPSGKAAVKKMNKSEIADAYLTLVCGHLLATIKEALAVAPGAERVKAVAVRRTEPDVYGQTMMEALIAGTYQRSNLDRVRWQDAVSPQIVHDVADDLLIDLKGRPPAMNSLDLNNEPDLKAFVDVVSERLGSA